MHDRILIIRPGALGDFILTLPLISGLRRLYRDAWIEALANRRIASLADGLADKTGDLDVQWPRPAGGASSNYIDSFDLVIVFSPDFPGPYVPESFRGEVVTVPPVPEDGTSASLFFFKSVPQLCGTRWEAPRVRPAADEAAQAERLLAATLPGRGRIAIMHPGSGSRKKCWPAEHFACVIRTLLAAGHRVLMLQGEADELVAAEVQRGLGNEPIPVLRDLPLRTLAAVLGRCDLYLGNDSGVSHLAAAAGAQCAVIFGPTDPVVWAPSASSPAKVNVIAADLPCRPCGKTDPACTALRCLTELSPAAVLEAMAGISFDS